MEDLRGRISELPDSILDSILTLLQLKSLIKTSILSSRWSNLWKHTLIHATTFDFGKQFAKAQTRQQFVTTVNKYLQLHNSSNIDEFLLYFHPGDDHEADVEKWTEFATSKRVKNLNLMFCRKSEDDQEWFKLPDVLFCCNSLIHFSASHVEFTLPSDFTGFRSLATIHLNRVGITDKTVGSLLSSCLALANLFLKSCSNLESIRVSGQNLKLECIANYALDIENFAPNLKSLHFYGDILNEYSFLNVASLEDLCISAYGYESSEPEHDLIQILVGVSHVKILTICMATPMRITIWREYSAEALPVTLPNLHELQIVVGGEIGKEYLGYIFDFFEETIYPCLEKLFIDLSGSYVPWEPYNAKQAEEPSSSSGDFSNLKSLKINHLRGE